MNHALKAAIALVMGVGLAAGAQAHGTNLQGTNMQGATATSQQQATMSRPMRHVSAKPAKMSRQRIKVAQRQRLQRHNGLRHTAKLHRRTPNRLTGNETVGVGSSMPPAKSNPSTTLNGNNNAATPMTPPATNPSSTGAGGSSGSSTGTTNQTPTTNKY